MCLDDIPSLINSKIDEMEAVKVFLIQISELYKEYNDKVVMIADDSEGSDQEEWLEKSSDEGSSSSESKFSQNIQFGDDHQNDEQGNKKKGLLGQVLKPIQKLYTFKKRRQPITQTDKAILQIKKIYQRKQQLEIQDSLKLLKQIFKGSYSDSIMKTDFVKNCKLMYTDTMDNMQDTLRNGLKQFQRHIKSVTDIMEISIQKLVSQQQTYEYI